MFIMPEKKCLVINSGFIFSISTDSTLLQSAYNAGLELPYRCASGCCGHCKVQLRDGSVEMDHSGGISREEIADGVILTCCSYPNGDIKIEV